MKFLGGCQICGASSAPLKTAREMGDWLIRHSCKKAA